MIGHLDLTTGTLPSHASWVAYKNLAMKSDFSQSLRADLDLIANEFKQIGLIGFLIMNTTIVCSMIGFLSNSWASCTVTGNYIKQY